MGRYFNLIRQLLLLLVLNQLATIDAVDKRIVGGEAATVSRVKYIVSLRYASGTFFCGGTLVAPQYVVTAAHCMEGMKARDFNVHGGATYLSEQGVKRSVARITIPKAFSMKNVNMDVAVLKLSEPMVGNNVGTIPLCSHVLKSNYIVKVSGWGLTDEKASGPSSQLRSVNIRLITRKKCTSNYRKALKITRTMMCAAMPGKKKDACSGDSGGPLVHNGQLCGVVSLGVGCARKQYPGVYTNVNYVKKFIRNAMLY